MSNDTNDFRSSTEVRGDAVRRQVVDLWAMVGMHRRSVQSPKKNCLSTFDLGCTAGIVAEEIGDGEVEVAVEADASSLAAPDSRADLVVGEVAIFEFTPVEPQTEGRG